MSQDHVPPQLTSEGEQLLADVLRRRAEGSRGSVRRPKTGHDTATARSSRERRERDSLRSEPADVGLRDVEGRSTQTRAGADVDTNWVSVISGVVVGAVVLVVLAFSVFSSPAMVGTEVAGEVEERSEEAGAGARAVELTEVETTVESEPESGTEVTGSASDIDGSLTGDGVEAQGNAPPESGVDPDSIEVIVYDEDPTIDGVHSFALRIKSISTQTEIDTESFEVVVVDEQGVESQTFIRFLHSTLPVESSAVATVRSEGSSPQQQYVVVAIGETEIARIPIGL